MMHFFGEKKNFFNEMDSKQIFNHSHGEKKKRIRHERCTQEICKHLHENYERVRMSIFLPTFSVPLIFQSAEIKTDGRSKREN